MTTLSTLEVPASLAGVPLVSVELAGTELPLAVRSTLGALRIRQEMSSPAVCQLDFAVSTLSPQVAPGQSMVVGVEGQRRALFTGEVVAVRHHLGPDGQHRVNVQAFDLSHRLRQNAPVRAFVDLTVADLVAAVADDYGLDVDAVSQGPRWPRVIQRGESDLELVSRLASEAGLWWQLEGKRIRLRSRESAEPARSVTWGQDLLEAEVSTDATAVTASVRALGWDPVTRAFFDVTATGESNPASASPEQVTGGDDVWDDAGLRLLTGQVFPTHEHAETSAGATLGARTRESHALRAVVVGDHGWRPGIQVTVADSGPDLSGSHQVGSVDHVVDSASGYVCVLDSRLADPPVGTLPGSATSWAMGEVSDIDDPEGMGRVRLVLPALDGLETEWLPVLTPGAGEDKGLLCQPDRGDTVLVLQPADDPGRGVVLGGLFTVHQPSDTAGITDGAVRRFSLGTPDGQRVVLDRDLDRVVVSNGAGSRIELTSDAVVVHAEADLTIEAPGRQLLFRADTIDFERG